jgi:hypothetical protein
LLESAPGGHKPPGHEKIRTPSQGKPGAAALRGHLLPLPVDKPDLFSMLAI